MTLERTGVCSAAQSDADELAIESLGNAFPDRCLAYARGTNETQDFALD